MRKLTSLLMVGLLVLLLSVSFGSYAPTDSSPPGVENPIFVDANYSINSIFTLATVENIKFDVATNCLCFEQGSKMQTQILTENYISNDQDVILVFGDAYSKQQGHIINFNRETTHFALTIDGFTNLINTPKALSIC